jgi:apolipoprotein N-acyltransferase
LAADGVAGHLVAVTRKKADGRPSHFARWWPWAAAVLSGVLLSLSFAPADIGGLAFVALVPLLMAVWIPQGGKWRGLRCLVLGYVTGLVFFTTTFWWLSELAPLFHSPGLNSLPLLLASELSLSPAVWAWLAGWIAGAHFRAMPRPDPLAPFERPVLLQSSRNLGIAIFCAAAWVALEWVRGWLIFSGFGWNALGVAMHRDLALIQIAEFTGVGGISFLLVMCNAIALITVLRVRAEIGRIRLRPHFDFAVTIGLVALAFGHGVQVLVRAQQAPADAVTLKVAAVQPNISQRDKFDIGRWPEIFARMESLSDFAAATAPDVLLWPEASVPGGMLSDEDTFAWVRERAAQVPALMLGTDDLNRGAPGEDHNSAAFIQAGEKEIQFYDKQQLVPFGEYLPLRPLLGRFFAELVPGDFKPGKTPGVFSLAKPALKIAPLICFEDTRGGITREHVRLGAHVLVNLTNDGWFGQTAELDQHMNDAVFRCIENRRPMVRCTNNGITASVDSFGRVDRWLEPFTDKFAMREMRIPLVMPETFYTRHGEVFSIACAIVVAVLGAVVAAMRCIKTCPRNSEARL